MCCRSDDHEGYVYCIWYQHDEEGDCALASTHATATIPDQALLHFFLPIVLLMLLLLRLP